MSTTPEDFLRNARLELFYSNYDVHHEIRKVERSVQDLVKAGRRLRCAEEVKKTIEKYEEKYPENAAVRPTANDIYELTTKINVLIEPIIEATK